MSETPKMIDQTPPRTTDTKDVAKVKIANVNNKIMATFLKLRTLKIQNKRNTFF